MATKVTSFRAWIKSRLPGAISLVKFLRSIPSRLSAKTWPANSIVYYTGGLYHHTWGPDSLQKGLGGSETAIIYLCREWTKLGYQVTVYNRCGEHAGIHEGVEYLPYNRFNPYDRFNVLIVWRYPWILPFRPHARQVWLDLHEVLSPDQVSWENLSIYNRVFVKSQYHRTLIPEIPDERLSIISNGIDSTYFELRTTPKQSHKLIYASNYLRGLERMLAWGWPIIKREIPNAELHIYYGWKGDNHPQYLAWKDKMLKLMNQPGVMEHGRVGQAELMAQKSTSTIHYYACTFQEIDCISIRESVTVGCIPVTSDHAALREKPYCVRESGNPYQQETQEKIAYKIVDLLRHPEQLAMMQQEFTLLAEDETWQRIAQQWLSYLN
jgi:hypothetical protein